MSDLTVRDDRTCRQCGRTWRICFHWRRRAEGQCLRWAQMYDAEVVHPDA